MNTTHSIHRRVLPALLVLAAVFLMPAIAQAQQFAWLNGKLLGIFKSTMTVGAASRSGTPQPQLVGAGAGQGDNPEFPGASGAVGVNDDGNLNFPRRDQLLTAPMTWTGELTLRHSSGQGVFLRVRAWYDMVLESRNVPHGSGMTSYTPNTRLTDAGNIGAAKFTGIDIYDAFFFGHYKVGGTRMLLRVGRQALDWGEGLFYPGINSVNPMDFAWATTTGARIANGGKLPVSRVYANVVGPAGFNIDGFVNLEFRNSVMPGCGTYFSTLDDGFNPGCNIATAAGLPDRPSALLVKTKNYFNGKLYPNGVYPNGAPDCPNCTMEPSRWSGWGVSAKKFVEPIGTEIGVYYADYTNPFPNNAPVVGTDALTFAINTNFQPVKSFAVSASTGVRNLALSGQFTRTLDFPAQRNAPAFIEGSLSGIGPYGYMKTEYVGREAPGYFPLNINQLQYGGIWQIGRYIGLSDATIIAEADMQWNTNQPPLDGPGAERLVRAGNFGLASWNQNGYTCTTGPLSNGIINSCDVDGFTTPFSMGYKVRFTTTTPQFSKGITMTPAFTIGHDISGYSADFAITGGRIAYGATLRTDIRAQYFMELGASWYRRGTAYDPVRDRGQYSFVFGWNIR
jgi:hypothetical protein